MLQLQPWYPENDNLASGLLSFLESSDFDSIRDDLRFKEITNIMKGYSGKLTKND